MNRYTIIAGLLCKQCRKDLWRVYQGFNRCERGQYLWIEKNVENGERHLHYGQGPQLPTSYKGWMEVTK